MTVEERVRRIEQWIASRDTAEMMRLQADIRVSLHTPFPDSPEDTAHLSFREQLALQVMRDQPMLSPDDMMARIRAIDAAVDAPRDEPAGMRRYCAKHAVGNVRGCGACKDERIAALEVKRDEARGETARARANEIQMRAERDEARKEAELLREKYDFLSGRQAYLESERDALRAQLADAHRVLAQGETIDSATERDTREKMERFERGVREAARLLRAAYSYSFEYQWGERRSVWLQEFGS